MAEQEQGATRTTARVAAAAVVLVAVLAGCGSQPPAGPAAAEAVSGGHSTPAERRAASPAPSPSRTRTGPAPGVSRPGLTVPATTAGPLDARSVPGPPALGSGWRRYVDPGQPEAGYLGNGSWVRSRDATDVVSSVVP